MWAPLLLSCALIHLATSAPSGTTSSCLASEYQTCNRYQQCCANRCNGPHETSCSEEGGRVKTASCQCKNFGAVQTRVTMPPSTHGRGDANQTCRTRVGTTGSCDSFKECCRNHCGAKGYSHYACSATNNRISTSTCTCAH